METRDVASDLRARWEIASRTVDTLLDSVESGNIKPDDVFPTMHHTIAVTVASLFGFTPKEAFIDTELLGVIAGGTVDGNGSSNWSR